MAQYVKVHTSTISGKIKPASRPKLDGSKQSAIFAAARMCAKYNRPFYVYLRYSGFGASHSVTYDKAGLSHIDSYIEVTGRNVYYWAKQSLIDIAEGE